MTLHNSLAPSVSPETQEWEESEMGNEQRKRENGETDEEEKLEREERVEDDLLEIAGARGKWTRRIYFLCAAVTFVVPLQSMSYQVLGATPPHWCLPSALAAANWTPAQVYTLAVPQSEAGQDEGCMMYDYNYTLAASLGFEESMADTGKLHEGPLSNTACTRRYFNSTHSTTVTEGKKTVLATEVEEKIADTVKRMEKMGLGPTLLEFREIVKDFLLANGIESVFNDGMPGYDWATAFMRRHNMTRKTSGMMQLARKSVTSDPFVIYDFCDLLRQEIELLEIIERPECIRNLDETGFPLDPSKAKTIDTKGAKTVRITSGSNRENISVLATCCADDTSLDPLIIFKGKNMQSSWVGTDALSETQYAVSESGWMTHVIFEDFFKSFVEKTKDIRPLLLILDGHLSHTAIATSELAKQENISIIKLPAHCTDLLQPLEVACFAPLKSYYDSALMRYVHQTGARAPLQKRGFVNMLCHVWKEGLSQENIKASFYSTGIHPLNPEKYTSDRLCPLKMKTYKTWIERGSPRDDENNPVVHVATIDTTDNRDLQTSSQNPQNPTQPSDPNTTNVSTSPIPEPGIEKGLSDTPYTCSGTGITWL